MSLADRRRIAVVALLMILFGCAEVVTAFRHKFFGISTSTAMSFTYAAAASAASTSPAAC
jgi:hypothetical protein